MTIIWKGTEVGKSAPAYSGQEAYEDISTIVQAGKDITKDEDEMAGMITLSATAGAAGLTLKDSGVTEGTPGTITSINFNDNLTVTRTGNEALIDGPGGSGSSFPVARTTSIPTSTSSLLTIPSALQATVSLDRFTASASDEGVFLVFPSPSFATTLSATGVAANPGDILQATIHFNRPAGSSFSGDRIVQWESARGSRSLSLVPSGASLISIVSGFDYHVQLRLNMIPDRRSRQGSVSLVWPVINLNFYRLLSL